VTDTLPTSLLTTQTCCVAAQFDANPIAGERRDGRRPTAASLGPLLPAFGGRPRDSPILEGLLRMTALHGGSGT
jgi:hypothetical protein